jgi:hypothetical protein
MAAVINTYCAIEDVEDVLSVSGVSLRSDDLPESPTAYGDVIARAGNRMNMFLFKRYDPNSLATSDLVKDWASIIAAYYLCVRRGNPPPTGIAILYEGVMTDLQDIRSGLAEIPGIAARKSYAPVMSIMRATQRPFPRAVVEKARSTMATGKGAENYHQNEDPFDASGWNNAAYLDWSI